MTLAAASLAKAARGGLVQGLLRLATLLLVLLASLPAAASGPGAAHTSTEAGSERHRVTVPAHGQAGGPQAAAGEFLVRTEGRVLVGHTTEHLGLGWVLLHDDSPLPPAERAAQLSVELGVPVAPNLVSHLFFPNPEPDAGWQWPLFNGNDADIDGEEAWDVTTGSGVTVAVLDSGIDLDHADLATAVWINPGETPGNGIDDDGNGFIDDVNGWDFFSNDADPQDEGGQGHGTFVSGIVGARINGVGIAGVAPDVTVMPVRVCGGSGCFDSDVIAGLAYALDNGARVANLSLGRGPGDAISDGLFETAFADAIDAGLSVVAAAGNVGADNDTTDPSAFPQWPSLPASFPLTGLLSVAMTDSNDNLDPFSNYGLTTVDLAAPGVSIYSTTPTGYTTGDGTSFSAPHVSGVAALVLAQDPCLTPAQVESRIRRSSDRLASLSGLVSTGGRLNAYRAVTELTASASPTYGGTPFGVNFSLDACSGSYPWDFGDGATATGPFVSHTYTSLGLYTATVDVNGSIKSFEIIAGAPFIDIAGNPFEEEILWLSAVGITLGCDPAGPGFCPDDTVTRGQMASFLARALGLPPAGQDYFTDDNTSTHQDNINRLRAANITLGCNLAGTEFCPDDEITREQMATFLARGYGLAPTTQDFFTDDSGVHEANINALAASEITLGCETGLFCPKDPVLRRQMAAFLFRADDV